MKNLKLFLFALVALITFASFAPVNAQDFYITSNTFDDRALLIKVASFDADSAASYYSDWFTLAGYDEFYPYVSQADTGGTNNLVSTYTVVPIYGTYKLTSSAGKPRITWIVQSSNDPDDSGTIATAASVSATADSTETIQTASISITTPRAYYRFKITGTSGNRSDTVVKGEFYLPRKRIKN